MSYVDFNKFDLMGMFILKDNKGIENLTTPLSNGEFLSRKISYYKQRTCADCSVIRDNFKKLLKNDLSSEKLFVIYENMLNMSAKVFYKELQNKISKKDNNFELAQACFEIDCYNLIATITRNKIIFDQISLPKSESLIEERQIELDNKSMVFAFCSSLDINKNNNIILTGLGGLYLAPFCKTLHNCNYEIAPLSAYAGAKDLLENDELNIREYLSNPKIIDDNKEIVFLDDNIGTGNTMRQLVNLLKKENKDCKCGAAQYNWINYHKVEIGEKDINRFKPNKIDFVTRFNYPGIKLLNHAIDIHLAVSGDDYINYLKSKSYRIENQSDLKTLALKGERFANQSGVEFKASQTTEEKTINKSSLDLNNKLNDFINNSYDINFQIHVPNSYLDVTKNKNLTDFYNKQEIL